MNKEEDFFERCVGIVAGLEVENEAQAIAKEVVLDEVENLQQRIDKAIAYLKENSFGISYMEIAYLLEILGGKNDNN